MVPINLGLTYWIGHRELSSTESQLGSEFEALGLALVVCAPIIAGWGLFRSLPSNRSKLRNLIRIVSFGVSAIYAPVITWLNIRSIMAGQALEADFQIYVAPMLFGVASLVIFGLLSIFCVMFTNKPANYNGFN